MRPRRVPGGLAVPVVVGLLLWIRLPVGGAVDEARGAGGTTVLVSSAQDGSPGNASSLRVRIAAGGSLVAFDSEASNLLPSSGDTNGLQDVFVKDMTTGAVELISVAFDGGAADRPSYLLDASADGRYVLFSSSAGNLTETPLDTCCFRVFLRDRTLGTTELIAGASGSGLLGDQGRYVFFSSGRNDLVPGQDQDFESDLFRLDRTTNEIELIGRADDGTEADAFTVLRFVSANGRFVGFWSFADHLVPADTNGRPDVFVRDLAAGVTDRVSVTTGGGETHDDLCGCGNYGATGGISDDGNLVLFDSFAGDLVSGDTNAERDVFLRDRAADTTVRVNVKPDGSQPNGHAYYSRLTPDGRWAAFPSFATDMVPGTLSAPNAIIADLTAGTLGVVSQGAGGPTAGVLVSTSSVDVSGDGRYVAFVSNTGSGGPAGTYQVYLRDLADDAVPPVVTGVPDRAPNGAGWYNGPVTIDWQADDPDPSSGPPTDPPDTSAQTEGGDVEYVSQSSCDPAGNCAKGTLALSIDMTPPTLGALSLIPQTVGTGDISFAVASASDGLSGVVGAELYFDIDPVIGTGSPMAIQGGTVSGYVAAGFVAGLHTVQVRVVDAAGNWSAPQSATLRVTTVASKEGCNFEQDASEDDLAIQSFAEQGRSTAVLCRDLTVDITVPDIYGPLFNSSATLTPGSIPAGTTVRSFLVHADRAYTVTKNGDFLVRQVGLQFTGGTVLGIAVRDATLNTTDLLGPPGTSLPTGLVYRGHEVNVRSGNKFLNPKDIVYLSDDRTTVGLQLQVGEAMDEVRIITTAGAELAGSSQGFRTVAPPPSLLQNEFDTEICQGAGAPSPKSCNTGQQDTSDDVVALFEQTDQDVRLRDALTVNISEPGSYTALPAATTIPAGTPLRSHLLHVDRVGPFDGFASGDFEYFVGSITFDRDILGIVTSDARLDASDIFGAAGVYYPTGWDFRGADFGLDPGYASDERIVLSADRRTITVQLQVANGLDEVRVITAGGPANPLAFVRAAGTGLTLAGQPFRFTGMNVYNANNRVPYCWYPMDTALLDQSFAAMGPGVEVIRAWFFQDFATSNGQRDWTAFDQTIAAAKADGKRLIVTLGNQWADCDSEGAKTPAWYADGYHQRPSGLPTPYRDYVAEVAARYRFEPTVLMWQLLNEAEVPLFNSEGLCEEGVAHPLLKAWADDVSTLIKSIDPNHLVSIGTIGSGQCGAQYTDYKSLHDLVNVDLCEFHDYGTETMPGDAFNGLAFRLQQCSELNKPLFVGETGINPQWLDGTLEGRAALFNSKFAAQFGAGVVGEAVWAWNAFESRTDTYDIGPGDPALEVLDSY